MIRLEISTKGGKKISLPLDDIVKTYGFKDAVSSSLVLRVDTNDAGSLIATVNDRDKDDYPGIDVDGELNGKLYYATSVELPNPASDVIISRLYCGNSDVEYDGPAVIMPLGDRSDEDDSRRAVLLDGQLAYAIDINSSPYRNMGCEELYKATTENSLSKLKVPELD